MDVPFLADYPGSRIAGVIGGDIFLAVTSRFDFDKKLFTLFYDKHAPPNAKKSAITLPLIKREGGIVPQFNANLPGNIPVVFTFDTGATTNVLATEVVILRGLNFCCLKSLWARVISEMLYQYSWRLALQKGFHYDDEQRGASWIENGKRVTYKYSAE